MTVATTHEPPAPNVKRTLSTEWWYYSGLLRSDTCDYGVHVAFFRSNTDGFSVGGLLPLSLLAGEVYMVHLAVTDPDLCQTYFYQSRSFLKGYADRDRLEVAVASASLSSDGNTHALRVGEGRIALEISISPNRPLISHDDAAAIGVGANSRKHQSVTRMSGGGALRLDGKTIGCDADLWMDRECGDVIPSALLRGWNWMAIRLQNGIDLMVYQTIGAKDEPFRTFVAKIDSDGQYQALPSNSVEIVSLRQWRSAVTGCDYTVDWRVTITDLKIDLKIDAWLPANELDARITTGNFYWEGPARVSGTVKSEHVSGTAFLEIVHPGQYSMIGTLDPVTRKFSFLGLFRNSWNRWIKRATLQVIDHRRVVQRDRGRT